MSTVIFALGSARNAFQSQRFTTPASVPIVNSHCSNETRGVGPAERTGKSVVRYCPGGSSTFAGRRRPEKPGETMPMISSSLDSKTVVPLSARAALFLLLVRSGLDPLERASDGALPAAVAGLARR